MKRLILLVLLVVLIVVSIAWVTGPKFKASVAAPRPGPGEAAWIDESAWPLDGGQALSGLACAAGQAA